MKRLTAATTFSEEFADELAPKVNILLVDDQSNNLVALEATLSGLGQNFFKARSGRECLRCLLENDFAVILMDVKMPGMDGFDTAALIRQRERSQHTPIIFLTAYETDQLQMFKGYSLGAVDYLFKPIIPGVLRAKVAVFVDIFRKTAQVKRQAELLRRIQQQEHESQLARARENWEAERLRDEISIARRIQQKLFPVAPLPLAGFDIAGASHPAQATGGDYFDYVPMQDGSLAIAIGDVSGHGFGPALLMAENRAYLRAFLMTHGDVAEVVRLLNRALAVDTDDDRFATLLLGRLDPVSRSLVYVSAGHAAGYLLDAAGNVKTSLTSTCMPLAIMPEVEVSEAPVLTLEQGEGVLLVTDGVPEAHAPDETLFGIERALNAVHANWTWSARDIVAQLFEAVRSFCGGRAALDDMTAIVIKVRPGEPANAANSGALSPFEQL
jgi:serine phosphatase RsbU (regulator of sigma subunit)